MDALLWNPEADIDIIGAGFGLGYLGSRRAS